MVKVYGSDTITRHVKQEYAFRPSGVGFIIVFAGTLKLQLNEETNDYKSGEMILLSPGNVYKILSFTDDLGLYLVSFDQKKLRQRINFNFNGFNSYRIIHGKDKKRKFVLQLPAEIFEHMLQLVHQLAYHLNRKQSANFSEEVITGLSSAIGFTIADELLKNLHENENRNMRKEQIALSFIDLVNSHFKTGKDLRFYADKLHISIKYLSNCVREVTTFPPTRFLAEAIVEKAKDLLLTTDDTIYNIAEELNFSDQYAFGKFFKKHTGRSPLNFRKQNQQLDTI